LLLRQSLYLFSHIRSFPHAIKKLFSHIRSFPHTIKQYVAGFKTAPSFTDLEKGEQDSVAIPRTTVPKAVFHLDLYELVHIRLPKVEPDKKILSQISLEDGSSVAIVLASDVLALELKFGIQLPPYNIEPSKEQVDLFGVTAARNQRIEELSRMAVDALFRDSMAGVIWADLSYVMPLFTTFFKQAVVRRILLDGTFDHRRYSLVRVSRFGYADTCEGLASLGGILNTEKLRDGSWELVVLRVYLPKLKRKLGEMFPTCSIEADYDPLNPTQTEVDEHGYEKAVARRAGEFCSRVKQVEYAATPEIAAFYSAAAVLNE
jgi:hypothetical protein